MAIYESATIKLNKTTHQFRCAETCVQTLLVNTHIVHAHTHTYDAYIMAEKKSSINKLFGFACMKQRNQGQSITHIFTTDGD